MGILGGLIGGATKAVAGIVGSAASARAAKRNQELVNQRKLENQQWYDQQYNADYTQRADAQAALNNMRSVLSERYASAQGAAAVGGATDESVAQQKAAANSALADTTTNIAASADAHKDAVRSSFEQNRNALDAQEQEINNQKAAAVAQAAASFAAAGEAVGGALPI
jgi:hypothetical protein